MRTDPDLEAISDKIRKGESVGFLEAIAAIHYQQQLRAEREANSLLGRLRSWWQAKRTTQPTDSSAIKQAHGIGDV